MLFLGVAALSSCDRNDEESVVPTVATAGQISHIMADSADVTSYNFAGAQLSQINHYNKETGELESFERYEHNSDGKVVKASTYTGDTHTLLAVQEFTYDNKGLLSKTQSSYYNGNKVDYTSFATYEYSTDNKLSKKSVFEGTEGKDAEAKSYIAYEVLPNGDYSQEKQYVLNSKDQAVLFSTTTYSYDANKNPFYAFAEPGKASSPNNLIAAVTQVHASKKTYKYQYAYQYNEQGSPISQAVTTPNGKSETYTYQYGN